MSDKEIIIRSLESVKCRIRANRLFKDLSLALALFLIFPVGFKILDLFSPFRGVTVAVVIGIWFFAFVAYCVLFLRRPGTLVQTAALVDHHLKLNDEITSAYWFICNPRSSEWVDTQIRRAAGRAAKFDVVRLYPRVVPSTSYAALGLLVLMVVLNLLPLSSNHNWFALQAAPAYMLSDKEQALFERTKELLQKTDKSNLAGSLENILKRLQSGDISAAEALKLLEELRKKLEEGKLDIAGVTAGLAKIAKDFEPSRPLQSTATGLLEMNLASAALQLREVTEKLGTTPTPLLRQMQQSFQASSENSQPELEALALNLKQAASGLKQQKSGEAAQALAGATQDLEQLARLIESQLLKDAASQELANLQEALQLDAEDLKGAGWTAPLPDATQLSGAPPGNAPFGLEPAGQPVPNPPRVGPPTSLKVQLEEERLTGQYEDDIPEENEASKQEQSHVDYKDVPSEFAPAQKDLMNPSDIPWEYRPLIKNYFQAIRPSDK